MDGIINELWVLVDIALAAFLGFFIGFERRKRLKEAGIRTHTIVCIGAALIMAVSKYAFKGQTADASRIAAQIVSGVGFLGAGIIVYRQQAIHGLTTAAGVWATAGVGMACGGRLYIVAAGATVVLIAVQCFLHLKPFRPRRYYSINIKFRYPETDNIKQVILYLCISLVQLYQKIITAPVFITKAVIVLIVPAKIQVTEPATVWGLLPLCLYVFKRKETSPYMVKNTIYNYF